MYGVWLMQVSLCRRWCVCALGCGMWALCITILCWKKPFSLYSIQVLVGTRLREVELPSSSVLPGPVEGILSDVVNRSPRSRGDSWQWALFQRTVPTSSSCGLGVDSFKYRWLWDVLLPKMVGAGPQRVASGTVQRTVCVVETQCSREEWKDSFF